MSSGKQIMDLWGWDYTDPQNVQTLLVEVEKVNGDSAATKLRAAIPGGGKAFGLALAELLTRHMEYGFSVPTWFYLTAKERALFQKGEQISDRLGLVHFRESGPRDRFWIRSSANREDWQDPASGTNESKVRWVESIPTELMDPCWGNEPVVIQADAYGVGMVVDLAYSPLLKRWVGRVSAGRYFNDSGQLRITSATWDSEGPTGVWDIFSGERLAWSPGNWTSGEFVQNFDYAALVKKLATACVKTGLVRHGLQFEVVIQPYGGDNVQIVQVRPTPGLVRGETPFEKPEINGELFATSGKVSGPQTAHTSPAISYRGYNDPNHQVLAQVSNDPRWVLKHGGKIPSQPFKGKVVVWRTLPEKYDPVNELWAVGVLGAVGQIGVALRTNTAHGTPGSREAALRSEPLWRVARQSGLMITLAAAEVRELETKLYQNPELRLTLVSDGLVGQVYLAQ